MAKERIEFGRGCQCSGCSAWGFHQDTCGHPTKEAWRLCSECLRGNNR